MLRLTAEGLALFLLPFAVYAVLLLAGPRLPFMRQGWSAKPVLVSATIGFALVVLGFLGLGMFSERYRGTYVPAHMDQGRLIPGQMK